MFRTDLLKGKRILVTGGGSGLGKSIARRYLELGAELVICGRRADVLEATAAELRAATGGVISIESCDVRDAARVEAMMDSIWRGGPLDVLVNNAGIMPIGPFLEEDDETARRIIDINVHGVIIGMKCALPRMIARGSGHVVNVASQAGKYGFPGGATYCASKAAVLNLSRAVRKELRGTGVDISTISPVAVNTELGIGLSQPRQRQFHKIEPRQVADAIAETLQVPRFDVHVPKQAAVSERINALMPLGFQDAMSRLMGADAVLSQVDAHARSGYELRAAGRPAALEPGEEQAQLTSGESGTSGVAIG